MKTKTIYESFINEICANCKNHDKDLCNITRKIDGKVGCAYYKKDKKLKGYEEKVKRRYRK